MSDFYKDYEAEHQDRLAAEAKLADRDGTVLALREALDLGRAAIRDSCHAIAIYGDQPPVMYLEALEKANAALASTAQAAQDAERRIRMDEREKCRPYMAHDATLCMGDDSQCTCGFTAILNTQPGGEGW
jgi:hypothetical protein